MVLEIVSFELPPGADRAGALALYRKSAEKWLANPDLVEKYYFLDEEKGIGGGVYIWPTRDAALRWHGEDYRETIRSVYGAQPRIQILEMLLHVDVGGASLREY